MRIKQIFLSLSGIVIAASVGIIGSMTLSRGSQDKLQQAYAARYESYLLADELRQSSDDLTRLVRTYVSTANPAYKDQYNAVLDIRNGKSPRPQDYYRIYWDFVAGGNASPRPLGETKPLLDMMKDAGFSQKEMDLLAEAKGNSDGLVNLEVEAMKLMEDTNPATKAASQMKAIEMVNSTDYHTYKAKIMEPIDRFYVELNTRLLDNIASATATANFYWLCMIVSVATLCLAIAGFGLVIYQRVVRGIFALQSNMELVSNHKLDNPVALQDRGDEIGDMARALEGFRQSAIRQVALEAEAVEARSRNDAERSRLVEEAEQAAQQRLNNATSTLAAGLKRLSDGDLSFSIDQPLSPEFEPLRLDLNSAVGQLRQTLSAVARSTEQIDTGSREISQSADDLSRRTEQQAAALEQTAAALDEITTNVANSEKRVQEARSVTLEANRSTQQSGQIVAKAVEAMGRIEGSSDQISNIITVIDEIAFQTNLLALNAGVEAARAGEAGKGFAVVAQEVRELAQRSAKAAKEIKELIRSSNQEVENGVRLVRETGDALQTIDDIIAKVTAHMEAIATSSREQSLGLAEVNTAVNQMDQVTQKNAAMVEETNAASVTLAQEVNGLREMIFQFKLAGGGSSGARWNNAA